MFAQCLVSFGSNLGSRDAAIGEAARLLSQQRVVQSLRTSRLFETPPIGGPGGQEPFLNAVAVFDTTASAREVLALLQSVEERLGRQRRRRWDARSIDLDVVLHGELVGGGQGLIVPHPRYTARQFVLQPACDVAAEYRDPRFGWTLRQLTDHVSAGVPSLALLGADAATRRMVCERLATEHGIRVFADRDVYPTMPLLANAPAPVIAPEATYRPPGAPGSSGAPGSPEVSTRPDALGPSGAEFAAGALPRPEALSEQVAAGKADAAALRSAPDAIAVDQAPCWVAAFVPPLPPLDSPLTKAADVPRLIARMQWATPQTRWPAPHQMWPTGGRWPEYRLEIDNFDWAISEVVAALRSMRCLVRPVTEDGDWWQ